MKHFQIFFSNTPILFNFNKYTLHLMSPWLIHSTAWQGKNWIPPYISFQHSFHQLVCIRVSPKTKSNIWRSTTLYIFQPWSLSHHKKFQIFLMQIERGPAIFIIQRKFWDLQRKIVHFELCQFLSQNETCAKCLKSIIPILVWVCRHMTCFIYVLN